MEIKPLPQKHMPFVIQILKDSGLPFSDIEGENVSLFYLSGLNEIIGIGGFEKYDELALIRSMAIVKKFQRKGFGSKIVSGLESEAKKVEIKKLFLLTTTAKDFFEKNGYSVIPRNTVPEEIKATTEFASLCPVAAVCMAKQFD